MKSQESQSFLRTRLIQRFIWHEDEAGTVIIGPSGIGKSTLIEQVRQTAGDVANFVEVSDPDELVVAKGQAPLFAYIDPADSCNERQLATVVALAATRAIYLVATFQHEPPAVIQHSIQDGLLRVIDAEAFRFDAAERHEQPILADEIDRYLDRPGN